MPIVYLTALVGAIASLLIGLLTLIRLRQRTSLGGASEEIESNPGMLPGEAMLATGSLGTGQSYPSEQPASLDSTVNGQQTANMPPARGVKSQPGLEKATSPGFEKATSTRWSLPTKYVVGVGLFLFLLFVVFFSRSVISMIIFAALLAFVVQPVVKLFQNRLRMKRGPAVGIAYLLVVILIILIPLVIIPAVVQSINNVLTVDWQALGENLALSLETAAYNVSTIPLIGPPLAQTLEATAQLITGAASLETPAPVVVDVSATTIGNQLANTLGKLAKILGPLISAITSLVFMLLISLRMSLAAHEMRDAYPSLVPPSFQGEISTLVERIINVWVSFLRGQLTLMVVMGFLVYLLNVLLGNSYPVFLGFLAGMLEIIPNLGPFLATIPAVIFALVFGSSHLEVSHLVFALIVILGYVSLSALENQILVPKILGDAVSLPPLVVIIGVVVGGATFGILGILLATPVISTFKEIIGYLYNKIPGTTARNGASGRKTIDNGFCTRIYQALPAAIQPP